MNINIKTVLINITDIYPRSKQKCCTILLTNRTTYKSCMGGGGGYYICSIQFNVSDGTYGQLVLERGPRKYLE